VPVTRSPKDVELTAANVDIIARRKALIAVIANDSHPYSVGENDMIATGSRMMEKFIDNPKKQKVRTNCLELFHFLN
jgi:hypothetical protein